MRMVTSGDATLCTDSFGDAADPAVLLIHGMNSSMDWWEEPFCRRLAAGGRFVLRYDARDTGASSHYPPGEPGYGGDDMVADAVAVLDAYGVARACVLGLSMGGAIAQVLALDHPDRVGSLVLASTTTGTGDDLPPPSPALLEFYGSAGEPDWSDLDAVAEKVVAECRALAGDDFDEAGTRELVRRSLARTGDVRASLTNHAAQEGGTPWRHRLGEIAVPTLVVHGAVDPLFPPEHGAVLAREIPTATLLTLPGVGHELPARAWDTVIPEVLRISEPSPT